MKKSLVLATLLFASTGIMAQNADNTWFVGAEFGGMRMDFDLKEVDSVWGTDEWSHDLNTLYESLKVGAYLGNL